MRKRLIAGLLAAIAMPGAALAACPFSYVFNYVSSPGLINILAGGAGAGTTTFQTSTSGAVSKISGPGSLSGSSSSAQIQVQMALSNCTTGPCSDTPTVTVAAIGTPTGLNQSLTAFTAASTGGGGITSTSGSAPLTIHLSPSGSTYYAAWNFNVGYNLPIKDASGGASGSGSSAVSITITPSTPGCTASVTTTTVPTSVGTPLAITSTTPFSFGSVVRPPSGSGTVTYTPNNSGGGVLAVTGGIITLASSAPSAGGFRIQGQQYKQVAIQVATSANLTHGADTIVLTPLAVWGSDAGNGSFNSGMNGAGQANISNANGAMSLYVGGSFTLSSSTPSGVYSGQINVTAAYQ
jgi:hypothetical protein